MNEPEALTEEDLSFSRETPDIIVNDRRASALAEEFAALPPGRIEVLNDPPLEKPARMLPGQYYEINGICYFVRKITNRDVILRRYTGTLAVRRVDATAHQIKNARPA